jgi:hypothetical protein
LAKLPGFKSEQNKDAASLKLTATQISRSLPASKESLSIIFLYTSFHSISLVTAALKNPI